MWAHEWVNIESIVKPFNDTTILDVTDEMVAQVLFSSKAILEWISMKSIFFQNYTADKMFHLAEEFFQSIGFDGMTDTFWEKSMITKPDGREVVCHASAEDFYEENDYRYSNFHFVCFTRNWEVVNIRHTIKENYNINSMNHFATQS